MWLITSFIAAVIATILWYSSDSNTYRLDILSLIFWGTTIMVFVDHLMGYLSEGIFLDVSVDALLLGIVMVFFGVFIWEIWLIAKDPKGKIFHREFRARPE